MQPCRHVSRVGMQWLGGMQASIRACTVCPLASKMQCVDQCPYLGLQSACQHPISVAGCGLCSAAGCSLCSAAQSRPSPCLTLLYLVLICTAGTVMSAATRPCPLPCSKATNGAVSALNCLLLLCAGLHHFVWSGPELDTSAGAAAPQTEPSQQVSIP
jgi:hypothetical protein